MTRALLTDEQLATHLRSLPGWSVVNGRLHREVKAAAFLGAIDLVNRVARVAESHDHHPDIHVSYKTVTLDLFTHDAGGLTAADVDLASALNPLLDAVSG